MELDKFKDVDLVIDYANDTFIAKQVVSHGDYLGRTSTVQITNGGLVGALPGAQLVLHWKNMASGLSDDSAYTLIDAENTIFRIEYPQNMLTPGTVKANILVIYQGKTTVSREFEITVANVAGQSTGVLAKAEFSALVKVLSEANGISSRLTALESVKADKTYVDSIVSSVASGGPKELFYSIQALKDKYPNGEIGTFLVLDSSFTDGAHSYIWSNGTWKDLGLYGQTDELATKRMYEKDNLIKIIAKNYMSLAGAAVSDAISSGKILHTVAGDNATAYQGIGFPISDPTVQKYHFESTITNTTTDYVTAVFVLQSIKNNVVVSENELKRMRLDYNKQRTFTIDFITSNAEEVDSFVLAIMQVETKQTNFILENSVLKFVPFSNDLNSSFIPLPDAKVKSYPYANIVGMMAMPSPDRVGFYSEIKTDNNSPYFNLDINITFLALESGSVTLFYEELDSSATNAITSKSLEVLTVKKGMVYKIEGNYPFIKNGEDSQKIYLLSYTKTPFVLLETTKKIGMEYPPTIITKIANANNEIQYEDTPQELQGATVTKSATKNGVKYSVTSTSTSVYKGIRFKINNYGITGVTISGELTNNLSTSTIVKLIMAKGNFEISLKEFNLSAGETQKFTIDTPQFKDYSDKIDLSFSQPSDSPVDLDLLNLKVNKNTDTKNRYLNYFKEVDYEPYAFKGLSGIKVNANSPRFALYQDFNFKNDEPYYRINIKQPILGLADGYISLVAHRLSKDKATVLEEKLLYTTNLKTGEFRIIDENLAMMKNGDDVQRLILISYTNTPFVAFKSDISLISDRAIYQNKDNFAIPKISISGDLSGMSADVRKNCELKYEYNGQVMIEFADIKWQGNSTLGFPKKGYRIRFYTDETRTKKKKVKLDPNDKAKSDFNLKANWQDWTGLNNLLIAKYAAHLISVNGDELTKGYQQARHKEQISGYPFVLYLNGECQYLYNVSTKKEDNLFNADEKDPLQAVIGGREWTAGTQFNTTPSQITFGATGDFEMEMPDELSPEIEASFREMYRRATQYTDNEFVANVNDYLSMQSVANWFVLSVLFNIKDGFGKNVLYQTRDAKKWEVVMYDMDMALAKQFNTVESAEDTTLKTYASTNKLIERAIKTKLLIPYLVKAWERFSKYISASTIVNDYRDNMTKIGSGIYENQKKYWVNMAYTETYDEKDIFNYIYDRYAQCEQWFTTDYLSNLYNE